MKLSHGPVSPSQATVSRRPSQATESRRAAKRAVKTEVAEIPKEIYDKKYAKAPEVGVAIKVISISHLDMPDNTFMADFNINIAWVGDKSWPGENKDDFGDLVQIYNQMEGEDPEIGDVKEAENRFDWYFRIRYKGKFRQRYYLQKFPFDEQKLTVRLRLKNECRLVQLPWGPSGEPCSVDAKAIQYDFRLTRAHVEHEYHPSYKFGRLAGYDPEALLIFTVQRKPDYWIINYGILSSLICTFAFAAFCIPVGDVSGRLGVGFTLNLTAVAAFYLMQDKLPAVPYLTELNKHAVICIFFTMTVMVLNCLPGVFGEEFIASIEKLLIIATAVLWIGYHILQIVRVQRLMKQRDEEKHAIPVLDEVSRETGTTPCDSRKTK